VVCTHGEALLADGDHVAMVFADLREPAEVLSHPEVLARIDLTQPVAVLCASVLHFVSDADNPHKIIASYRDRLVPGSHLVISHGAAAAAEEDPTGVVDGVTSVYRQASAQLHVRSVQDIARFFDGFELLEPGLVWMTEWRPDPDVIPAGHPKSLRAGVGRKL
jgi:hypothetical protein